MQWLGTTYTRRFNLKHSRSGHLFQGRFKSKNSQYKDYVFCMIVTAYGLYSFGQSFGFIGQSQRMASAATFLPFDIGFRLHMGIGHDFKGNQAEGMFAGGETETETDGKETSASVCVGINRCTSEHNRGIVCGKTEGPGLCGGVG